MGDDRGAFCLSSRRQCSRLPLEPTRRTRPLASVGKATSRKSFMRKRIPYLGTKLPHLPRREIHSSWETTGRHRWISNSGTSPSTPPRRAPGPRCSPRTAVRLKSVCRCPVLHHRPWQQPSAWWWKTPTLTQHWVLRHQRRHQRTLLMTGEAAATLSHPRCRWTTRIWSWTLLLQVNEQM